MLCLKNLPSSVQFGIVCNNAVLVILSVAALSESIRIKYRTYYNNG